MKRYVLQRRENPWSRHWETLEHRQYDSLEEARQAIEQMPFKSEYRIAEPYTVTRFRAVK